MSHGGTCRHPCPPGTCGASASSAPDTPARRHSRHASPNGTTRSGSQSSAVAGRLLRVDIGHVDDRVVTPSRYTYTYTYTTVAGGAGSRRVARRRVFQMFTGAGSAKVRPIVQVYVESGRVGIGVGTGGALGLTEYADPGSWQTLEIPPSLVQLPATEISIASIATGTSCFDIDYATVQTIT